MRASVQKKYQNPDRVRKKEEGGGGEGGLRL